MKVKFNQSLSLSIDTVKRSLNQMKSNVRLEVCTSTNEMNLIAPVWTRDIVDQDSVIPIGNQTSLPSFPYFSRPLHYTLNSPGK